MEEYIVTIQVMRKSHNLKDRQNFKKISPILYVIVDLIKPLKQGRASQGFC